MENKKELNRRIEELDRKQFEAVYETGLGTLVQRRTLTEEEHQERKDLVSNLDDDMVLNDQLEEIEDFARTVATVIELDNWPDAYSPAECILCEEAAKDLRLYLGKLREALAAGSITEAALFAKRLGEKWQLVKTIPLEPALSREKRHRRKQVALGRRGRRWSVEEEEEAAKLMRHRLEKFRTTKKDAALWVKGKMGLDVGVKTIQGAYRKWSQKSESAAEN